MSKPPTDTDEHYAKIFKAFESEGQELDPNFDDDSKDKKELDPNFGTKNHQSPDIDNNKDGEIGEAEENPDKVEDEGIDPNKDTKLHEGEEAIKEGDDSDFDKNFADKSKATITNNEDDESVDVKADDNKWDNHPDMTGEVRYYDKEAMKNMGYEMMDIYDTIEHHSQAIDEKDFTKNFEDETKTDKGLDPNFKNDQYTTGEQQEDDSLVIDNDKDLFALHQGIMDKPEEEVEEAGVVRDPIYGETEDYDLAIDEQEKECPICGIKYSDPNHFKFHEKALKGEAEIDSETFDTNFTDKSKTLEDPNFSKEPKLSDEAVGDIEDVNQQFKSDKDLVGRTDINTDRTGLTKKKGIESFACTYTCNCGAEVNENDWTKHTLMHANERVVPIEGIDESDEEGKASEDNFYNPDPNHDIGDHKVLATTGRLSDVRGGGEPDATEQYLGDGAEQYQVHTCDECGAGPFKVTGAVNELEKHMKLHQPEQIPLEDGSFPPTGEAIESKKNYGFELKEEEERLLRELHASEVQTTEQSQYYDDKSIDDIDYLLSMQMIDEEEDVIKPDEGGMDWQAGQEQTDALLTDQGTPFNQGAVGTDEDYTPDQDWAEQMFQTTPTQYTQKGIKSAMADPDYDKIEDYATSAEDPKKDPRSATYEPLPPFMDTGEQEDEYSEKCPTCGRTFDNPADAASHDEETGMPLDYGLGEEDATGFEPDEFGGDDQFQIEEATCPDCGTTLSSGGLSGTNPTTKCPNCGKDWQRGEEDHLPTPDDILKTEEQGFTSPDKYIEDFDCPHCGKSFGSPDEIKNHLKIEHDYVDDISGETEDLSTPDDVLKTEEDLLTAMDRGFDPNEIEGWSELLPQDQNKLMEPYLAYMDEPLEEPQQSEEIDDLYTPDDLLQGETEPRRDMKTNAQESQHFSEKQIRSSTQQYNFNFG